MERLQKAKFFVVDQGILDGDALQPFAFEEVMMRLIGQTGQPLIHIWRHARAFIAGLRDRRLPYAAEALQDLRAKGYAIAVRNSGGAAVPLHAGVVNISVIFPNKRGAMDIHEDFSWMENFVSEVLSPLGIRFERGEVGGSYCPGDFDLSIGGRKFCGIAQRRRLEATSLQAFINVEGDGEENGRTAAWFYERAVGGLNDRGKLQIEPERITSLQQLHHHVSVETFMDSLSRRLREWGAVNRHDLPERFAADIHREIELMRRRYDR